MTCDHTFIAILATPDGERRFRTAVIAENARHAREKAERITADIPGFAVELIFLEGDDDAEREASSRNESRWDDAAC